ncbi:P-loop containing nucleoside triphosphate hydrolase [Pseudocohnilembus persalinus]|uniref:p-loop containing nucleoside triphosphate hydrolase n=1 Tax=Pseudocohnilembus persalinus TaxID=266149 RepID=A0A0V0QTV0_PSEPJ|nr:P-loop containing nucleoside triphosphate hydrolase [Pseudocohnilembus persalinus]|eukprot:KRX05352.1 P-loop containing nucleoside triphosphate hydrolase [Pseudocohnilembus persalinus]
MNISLNILSNMQEIDFSQQSSQSYDNFITQYKLDELEQNKLLEISNVKQNVQFKVLIAGLDCFTKYIEINQAKVKLNIWDPRGQDLQAILQRDLYQNAQAVIFMYAQNEFKSFSKIEEFIEDAQSKVDLKETYSVLLANKTDLKKQVSDKLSKKLCKQYELEAFIKTMAIDEQQRDDFYKHLAETLLLRVDQKHKNQDKQNENIKISKKKKKKKKNKC